MILFPNAKINVGLTVCERRKDGYHNIASTLLPVPIHDVIEILPSNKFQFLNTGVQIDDSSNLVVQAFNLMKEKFNIPDVYIHLHKCIPLGSGLGGGSSDAAFTLKGLNDLFQLNISQDEMKALALELGSDCPFFVFNQAANIRGRGEQITPAKGFAGSFCKVIYPGINISTKEAFQNLIRHDKPHAYDFEFQNDFENWAFQQFPELERIKEQLYKEGAYIANMTGSGSAIFGIYKSRPKKSTGYNFEKVFQLK